MSMLLTLPDGSEVEIADTVLSVETELGSVTAHRNKAKSRTIERWKDPGGESGYAAQRASYADEIQELENAIWSVKYSRLVDDAFGESLNMIGRIVGEGRDGKSDASYRVRIKARIRVNQSFGTGPDLLAVCRLLDPANFKYQIDSPKAWVITVSVPLTGFATALELADLLGEASSLCVQGLLVVPTDAVTPFILADTAGSTVIGSDLGDYAGSTVPLPHIPDVRSV